MLPSSATIRARLCLVTSYDDNVITLNYFDNTGQEYGGKNYVIQGKNSAQIPLASNAMRPIDLKGGVPEYRACHITARYPISVQYYSTGPNSGGLYLGLPTPALGTKYVIASLPANPGIGAGGRRFQCNSTYLDSNASEFMIIAPFDNTTVTITPTGTTQNGWPGSSMGTGSSGFAAPQTVSLNRGQIFWVRSEITDEGVDETGSVVSSDKPVAVLAGNDGALNGITQFAGNGQEQRDLSIEEMVPVDYWDGQDNLCMPLIDSPTPQPGDDNIGEMYRVVTYDSSGSNISFAVDQVANYTRFVGNLGGFAEFANIITGINASSLDGKQIFVSQYDYRQHNQKEPFPAPSQTNVIPISHWRKSFLWMVPDDAVQVHKLRFANILANPNQMSHIMISQNGGTPQPLSGIPSYGPIAQFPGHSINDPVPIVGKRIQIYPGSYYATGDSAFMVYEYGFLGLDPDNDLGDNDDDDYYFAYSSTCGQSFGIPASGTPKVMVDTLCAGWNFTVMDTATLDKGLADVELLNDPKGVYTRPGLVSYNVALNPSYYSIVPGVDSARFSVQILNPLQNAYAAIFVVNRAGNDTVIELHYSAPKLTLTPDTANLKVVAIGSSACTRFVLKNIGKPTDQTFSVSGIDLRVNDGNFNISSITPAPPFTLKPGDTLAFTVCYAPKDTGVIHFDSAIIHTNCFDAPAPMQAMGATPIIFAGDVDFGTVAVGETHCQQVTITNLGAALLVLTKQWLLHNSSLFSFPDSTKLPITLLPGKSVTLIVCYTPTTAEIDSTNLDWGNIVLPPFAHQIKDFSRLQGKATNSTVLWLRSIYRDTVICDSVGIFDSVVLTNIGASQSTIESVSIVGPDASEYKIIGNDKSWPIPIPGEPLTGGDTVRFAIQFTPDLTKPLPQRWADRHMTLVTTAIANQKTVTDSLNFISTVLHADIAANQTSLEFGKETIGVLYFQKVVITNPGTAPLHVSDIQFQTPPVVSVSGLNIGDVIPPGGADTIIVGSELFSPIDTSGPIAIAGLSACVLPLSIPAHAYAATLQVQGTNKQFDSTFLNCRMDTGTTFFTNLGTTPVQLLQAQILSDSAHPNGGQFVFPNGTNIDSVKNTILDRGDSYKFSVLYTPTDTGNAQALIVYTWDTSGVRWTTTAVLSGNGVLLVDTISALAVNAKPITAKTADIFDVPIRMTQPLPPNGGVYGCRFDVLMREDLFDFVTASPAPGLTFVGTPSSLDLGNGFQRVRIVEMSPTPITSLAQLADLKLRLVVSKDLSSDFTITNVAYLDKNQDSLCYILNKNIDGSFTPIDLCGDPTTRDFLDGTLKPAVLGMVIPNPTRSMTKVHFDVNIDNSPIRLEVYNVMGELVQTAIQDVPYPKGSFIAKVDFASLPSGMYTIRLTTQEWTEGRMVMVTK
jgi:hypothetical protein